jgi:hypothetical protein
MVIATSRNDLNVEDANNASIPAKFKYQSMM